MTKKASKKKAAFNGHHSTVHGKAGKRLRKQGCIKPRQPIPSGEARYAGERRAYLRICPECRIEFATHRVDAVTCGAKCRQQRSRRQRQQSDAVASKKRSAKGGTR